MNGFAVTFQMTRADYSAMFRAMMGRPWWNRWVLLAGWIALWLAVMLFGARSMEHFRQALAFIVQGKAGWGLYLGFLMLPLLFFWENIAAYTSGVSFARNELARKPTTVRADADGVHIGIDTISSDVGWSAILKVIETAERLFLTISTRQAVVLPRRAFASEADYAAARDFIREHIGRETPFVTK